MKKKICALVIGCLLMCGCSAEYNLTINNDLINEDISIEFPFSEFSNQEVQSYANQQIPISMKAGEQTFYTSKYTTNRNGNVINYSYEHSFSDFNNSYFINNCYGKVDFINNESEISIKTSDKFNCIVGDDGFYAKQVTVNIITDLNVVLNNADTVNGNTYTWVFNENNYQNKNIKFQINKLNATQTIEKDVEKTVDSIPNKEIIIICIVLIIIGSVLYFVIKRKQDKKNKI